MTSNDVLMAIWHYREKPDPSVVPHLFTWTEKERLLWNSATAIGWAGVITGLCDRHPFESELWCQSFPKLIKQAVAIAKHRKSQEQTQWGDYLAYRWIILATDRAAWELLQLAHCPVENLRTGAQSAITKIIFSYDGVPARQTNGDLIGTAMFDDLRKQMTRLADEFRKMSPIVRKQPFASLSFSRETINAQLEQAARMGFGVAAGAQVIQ